MEPEESQIQNFQILKTFEEDLKNYGVEKQFYPNLECVLKFVLRLSV
jgi:hypothetical protein